VWNAKANHLGTIIMPEQPANMTWGDKDYHTLYITATTSVCRFRDENAGLCPLSGALNTGGRRRSTFRQKVIPEARS
jgi:sugar lactone lactonase YvrE